MSTVRWAKYHEYSGCRINGTLPVPKPASTRHMERAYYLVTQIEAPRYGSVQSYDGAGMSGGPLHNIAVYPRTLKQGSLFQLLRFIDDVTQKEALLVPELRDLKKAWEDNNWVLSSGGVLCNARSGVPISGETIRHEYTPPEGRVPRRGREWSQAMRWAWLHHRVLGAVATFSAQKQYSINWLINTQRSTEAQFYRGRDPQTIDTTCGPHDLSPEEDLAMCAYHCYSVNAPAPAKRDLARALKAAPQGKAFARALLTYLHDTAYGNWGVRYIRTRTAAMNTGFWAPELFIGSTAIFKQPRSGNLVS